MEVECHICRGTACFKIVSLFVSIIMAKQSILAAIGLNLGFLIFLFNETGFLNHLSYYLRPKLLFETKLLFELQISTKRS